MSVLQINKVQNVSEVESELQELQQEHPGDIQLPVKVIGAAFGGEAALIQLVITWAKRAPSARLITHIQNADEARVQLDRTIHTGFGFVACMMAKDIRDVRNQTSLTSIAYPLASERVDKMARGPSIAAHGNRILLASVDHSSKWQLPSFYFSNGEVRERSDFRNLVRELFTLRASDKLLGHITPMTLHGLGTILHELVRNTHDWARTDESGVPVRRSVRGILVESHNLEPIAVERAAAGSQALAAYVQHPRLRGTDGRLRCLELSIFDSGPGLAKRWLGRTMAADSDLSDEYGACMECLKKHRSSSSRAHAGIGLYEVVRTLAPLLGFVRIRTGRLALYRDFVARPLQASEQLGADDLYDWDTATPLLKEKPSVEGALFTLLIPLGVGAS